MPPTRFIKPADALDLLKLKDNASRQALIKYLEELQRADPGAERRRDNRVHLETIENVTLLIKTRDASQRFVAMMYDLSTKGVGVIHGGTNSLRFTPHFGIGSDEVELMIEAVRHALTAGPRKAVDAAKAA